MILVKRSVQKGAFRINDPRQKKSAKRDIGDNE